MGVIYYKVVRRIKQMIYTQGMIIIYNFLHCITCTLLTENNENTPLYYYGANQAMIIAGQKTANKRIFLFFAVYIITGAMSEYIKQ